MVNSSPGELLDAEFHALSHPARRAIVGRLARGPASVTEAGRATSLSKPALSKHVRVLEDAGMVRREVQGRVHLLTLRADPLARAGSWIDAHRALWERKIDVVAGYLEERRG